MDFSDVFVAEVALAAELEHDGDAVALGGGVNDGELHGVVVPGGVGVAVSVDGGPLLRPLVAGDRNDDVHAHPVD